MIKMVKYGKNDQNNGKNDQKCFKGTKWSKTKMGQKWQNMTKMVKNGKND